MLLKRGLIISLSICIYLSIYIPSYRYISILCYFGIKWYFGATESFIFQLTNADIPILTKDVIDMADDENKDDDGAKPRGKNREFPHLRIEDAIAVAKIIDECGGSATKANISEGLGKKGGNLAGHITNASRYGLLEGRGSFKLTPLGKMILYPTEEGQDTRAKIQAFLGVGIFKAIYERFKGKYPRDDLFQNILVHDYQMDKKDAIRVTNIIKDFTTRFLVGNEGAEQEEVSSNTNEGDVANNKPQSPKPSQTQRHNAIDSDLFEILLDLGYLRCIDAGEPNKEEKAEARKFLENMLAASSKYQAFNSALALAVNIMKHDGGELPIVRSILKSIDDLINALKKDLGISAEEQPTEVSKAE